MNASSSQPELRAIPLACLALAPENVRATPPSPADQAQLTASIKAHGLLESLVVRHDNDAPNGPDRFAVIAGGRRLAALNLLAEDGTISATHPVPCQIVSTDNTAELSLAENVMRIAMHPADQVVAFKALADTGSTTAAIAARFGVTERLVEQRLRLGNVAPQLLDAYRADRIDLAVLQAFAITTDHEQQLAAWNQIAPQGYRPNAWQVKRILTESPVPASSAIARFVGLPDYEAAGGSVLRDLFADEHEAGTWLEDRALLDNLATTKLTVIADQLAQQWKWSEAATEVEWSTTARYGRVHAVASQPTTEEAAELERLDERHDVLANLDNDDWTEDLLEEAETVDARYNAIKAAIDERATFSPEDMAIAGCIATISHDGSLEVVKGLVRPDDMPANRATDPGATATTGTAAGPGRTPPITDPVAPPPDPVTQARKTAGVGIGLADDLRAIRNTAVKLHLSENFPAAFDLLLFQLARSVFAAAYQAPALDIATRPTADRPFVRGNDDDFTNWNPDESKLDDRSHLPFDWMENEDDGEAFAAMCSLSENDKQALFAAAVARTVKGQLAFEHEARPELEATIARLDIDFTATTRPSASLFWSRIPKDRSIKIARATLGDHWATTHSRFKKPNLANALERAFASGPTPIGVSHNSHRAALAWSLPGFAPFDDGALPSPAPDNPKPAAEAPASASVTATSRATPSPAAKTQEPAPAPPNDVIAAIDAKNRVPTADGSPRVVIATIPDPGDNDNQDLPEFLRNA